MKVLIINTIQYNINGIANVICSHIKGIKKNYGNIEFFVSYYGDVDKKYLHFFEVENVKLLQFPSRKNIISYRKKLKKVLAEEKIDVSHIHGNSSTMLLESMICKRYSYTIVHAHNTNCSHKFLNSILHPFFMESFDFAIACSKEAGEFLFNNSSFFVLNNSVDFKLFSYCQEKRNKIRKVLNVENKKVILHVGHFNIQKNQTFLIECFKELPENYILLFIGDGELKEQIQKSVPSSFKSRILFLGEKTNVNEYYSAADVFALPSLFESFGIVFLEAQANGLPCVCSTFVPRAAQISKNVCFLALDKEKWNEKIKDMSRKSFDLIDNDQLESFSEKSIDEKLYKIYLNGLPNK